MGGKCQDGNREVRFALKQGLAKERKRSCLREEIRGHLRVEQTQQRQLEKVKKEEIEHKTKVNRKKSTVARQV